MLYAILPMYVRTSNGNDRNDEIGRNISGMIGDNMNMEEIVVVSCGYGCGCSSCFGYVVLCCRLSVSLSLGIRFG